MNRWCAAALVGLLIACAGSVTEPPTASSPPSLDSFDLPDAMLGATYRQQVLSTGGTAPMHWELKDLPSELGWLSIGADTGILSGTPQRLLASKLGFSIRVVDSRGLEASAPFALRVVECTGKSVPCSFVSGDACLVGQQLCVDGRLTICSGGSGSTVMTECGAANGVCGVCNGSANNCLDGRCACGIDGPCPSDAPDCCGPKDAARLCTNVQKDPNHCGACDVLCTENLAHVVRGCNGGTCTYECEPNWARCPALPAMGACDVDLLNDNANCGGCGNACPVTVPNAHDSKCTAGRCTVTCDTGFANCDTFSPDCETDLNNSDGNCGACGTQCSATLSNSHCSAGGCVCNAGYTLCNGECVDLQSDERYCGSCTTTCNSTEPYTTGSGVCEAGNCKVTGCTSGRADCDGVFANGCESDLRSDSEHCGSCSTSCGGYACSGGRCTSCYDCDGVACCSPNLCVYDKYSHSLDCISPP